MWTRFMDMHSGGSTKEPPFEYIYIEAPEAEAKTIFYNRFGHNPENIACSCCGENYSIDESETLEQASGYDRNCAWDEKTRGYIEEAQTAYSWRGDLVTLEEYINLEYVKIIWAADIKPEERKGELPRRGWVWID